MSSRDAGGRFTPGTGPGFPVTGGAEAGEVDRRIQIPVRSPGTRCGNGRCGRAAGAWFSLRSASTVESTETTGRGHQRGAIPGGLVAQLGADTPIAASRSARLRPRLRRPPCRVMFLAASCSTHHRVVGQRQISGGLVDLIGADRGHLRMDPAHPGVGARPAFRRLPPRLRVGIVGATPARRLPVGPPAAATAPGSTVGAPLIPRHLHAVLGGDHQPRPAGGACGAERHRLAVSEPQLQDRGAHRPELCITCGLCHIACEDTAHQAIAALKNEGKRRYEVIDAECVGCNLCMHVCPVPGCITMAKYGESEPYLNWTQHPANPMRKAAE